MTKPRSFIWVVIIIGLAIQLICGAAGRRMDSLANVYTWLGMGGTIILVVACAFYAEQKGYSRNYGLVAFFSIFGVILLALLPAKPKV